MTDANKCNLTILVRTCPHCGLKGSKQYLRNNDYRTCINPSCPIDTWFYKFDPANTSEEM